MPVPRILLCACGLCVTLAACSTPPGLEAGAILPPSTQKVGLLPLDDLLAQANGGLVNGGMANEASAAALAARAARLRAKAAYR